MTNKTQTLIEFVIGLLDDAGEEYEHYFANNVQHIVTEGSHIRIHDRKDNIGAVLARGAAE